MEEELALLHEKETELKLNQIRQTKEENMRIENFERQVIFYFLIKFYLARSELRKK